MMHLSQNIIYQNLELINMAKLSFLQAIIFTVFLIIAMQGFILGYLWRNGILPPDQTGAELTKLLSIWGPFAFLLDLIIITPLLWWFGGKFLPSKPKVVPPIVPPMIDLPQFVPPSYDYTLQDSEEHRWEELSWLR